MDVSVLGPLTVTGDKGSVQLGGARQRRLMAALVLHRGEVVSVDALAEIVFEGAATDRASTTMRSYIARLRRALVNAGLAGNEIVRTEAPGYSLHVEAQHVDALVFVSEAERGRELLRSGEASAALETLTDALGLWRGAAYEEYVYEDWALAEASRLDEERLLAEELLAESMLACGLTDEVVPRLRHLIAENPLRERPRAHLMLALFRAGRQTEALRAYQEFRRELAEVALEPTGELVALDRGIAVQDPALLLASPSGRALRGYRLGERIGEGRHGVVYRGIQPGIGRDVAVKTIRPDLADDPTFIRRFDSEARLVSQLEHPRIVPLYDFWREPGGAYMVMRLLASDLEAQINIGPLAVDAVVTMADQLGSALTHAHRSGVIHGDIRATNVLVDDDSNVYLSDFGLAFLAERPDGTDVTSSGYESPEQLRGERLTEASDQFGFAVLLSHMLSGRLPFGTRAISSEHDQLPSVHLHRPSVPDAADAVLARAVSWDPADRYASISTFLDALLPALGGDVVRRPQIVTVRHPYRGLRTFSEGDAEFFFGREHLVREVLDRLADPATRCVTLIGASGSGKSSVVRAGLLPALRRGELEGSESWLVVTMTPGSDPFRHLASALRAVADNESAFRGEASPNAESVSRLFRRVVDSDTKAILFLDQMEELFTLVNERTRDQFVAGLELLAAENWNVRIVATLRADFYDRPLRYQGFGHLISAGSVVVTGLSAAELDDAVRGPANVVGIEVEPALTSEIVSEVLDQAASLPLLQYTLTELFDRRAGSLMTLDAYREIGGVEGAIARRADRLFDDLDEVEQRYARRLFLRLVTLDANGTATCRRVLRADLEVPSRDPEVMREIVERFGEARLVTFDRDPETREPTVELAHESLITGWPGFAEWIDEESEGLRIHARLSAAASSWEQADRDESELYRGGRLEVAESWAATNDESLTESERDLIATSVVRREAESVAVTERYEHERQTSRRLRRQLVGIGVVLAVALVAGLLAFVQRNSARDSQAAADAEALNAIEASELALEERVRADDQADEARTQAERADEAAAEADSQGERADQNAATSRARALAASSVAVRDSDSQLALLLAVEAADVESAEAVPQVHQALQEALTAGRELFNTPTAGQGIAHFSLDGSMFVATSPDDNRYLDVRRTDSLELELRIGPHDEAVTDAVFSPDGARIVSNSIDETISGGSPAALYMWDVASGELIWTWRDLNGADFAPDVPFIPAFSNDGTLVAGGPKDLTFWDSETGLVVQSIPPVRSDGFMFNLAFSPDDTLVAASYVGSEGSQHPGMIVWDRGSAEPLWFDQFGGFDVAFSPDGGTIYAPTGVGSTINFWNALDGTQIGSFDGHTGPVSDLHVSTDTGYVASSGFEVFVWDPESGEVIAELVGHRGEVDGIDITADGSLVITSSGIDRTTRLWDSSPDLRLRGPSPAGLGSGRPAGGIDYSPDGAILAVSGPDGAVELWDRSMLEIRGTIEEVGEVRELRFSSDGSELVAATVDGPAVIDPVSGDVSLLEELSVVASARFDPGGDVLSAGVLSGTRMIDDDGTQKVFAEDGKAAALSPDGAMVVTSYFDQITLRLDVFDAVTGEMIERLPVGSFADVGDESLLHIQEVSDIEFNDSGSYFASGGVDGRVVVWSATTFEPIAVLEGHSGAVLDVSFNPTDSNELASTGSDGTVIIWDIESRSSALILDVGVAVSRVAYHPDGSELAVVTPVGEEGVESPGFVQIYSLDFDDILADARSRVVRDFTEAECSRFPDVSCE